MTQPHDHPDDALIDSVFAAVNSPALWPDVASQIGERLDGTAYLFEFSASGRHTGRYCPPDRAGDLLALLASLQTASKKSMLVFLLADAELQTLYCKQALTSHIDLDQAQELDEGLAGAHGLLSPVHDCDGARSVFMLLSEPGGPGLAPANFPFTRRLVHALGRGLDIACERRAHSLRLQRNAMLNRHDGGACVLVDTKRRVVASTPGGTEALLAADLFETRSGRLQIAIKDIDDLLENLLAEIRHSPDAPLQGTLHVRDHIHSRPDGSLCRFVLRSLWPVAEEGQEPLGGHVLVTLRQPLHIPRETMGALQNIYGLSVSEARLAYYLARTSSIADTLDTLGITRNTGKTHLRRIYEKTATTSQVELFQLIVRIAALY